MAEEKKYELDKTASQAMSVEEADSHYTFWKKRVLKNGLQPGVT
jgi:hypothetical protein